MALKETNQHVHCVEGPFEVGQPTLRYKGIDVEAIVTRFIELKNGGELAMFSSGDKVIEMSGLESCFPTSPNAHLS